MEKEITVSEAQGWGIFSLGLIVVILSVTWTLWNMISFKKMKAYITISVWLGWFCCFGIILLLPLDVTMTLYGRCVKESATDLSKKCHRPWIQMDDKTLLVLWRIVYWTAYILCWTAYPFLQSFAYAGDFSFGEKCKSAIKENMRYWMIMMAVFIPFVIYLFVAKGVGFRELLAAGMLAASAFGLVLFVIFIGHGMVEIPKRLWRLSNKELTLKKIEFELVTQREFCDKVRRDLDNTLRTVKAHDEKMQLTDPMRPYLDRIIRKCPTELYQQCKSIGSVDRPSLDKLVVLNAKVIQGKDDVVRETSLYERLLNKAFDIEDVRKSRNNTVEKAVRWSFKPRRTHKYAKAVDTAEWIWFNFLEGPFLKLLSLFCICLSGILLWTEVFFTVPDPDLSAFSKLLDDQKPYYSQWFFTAAPIVYIVFCTYWSILNVRIFRLYRLLPEQHTDANSIIFGTMYLCRLTAPIAYNYLLTSRVENTMYFKLMGPNEFLQTYNRYFPIMLVIVVIFNVFNLYTWCIHKACFKSFHKYAFDETVSEEYIAKGAEILAVEREVKERLNSGTSLDIEEGVRLNESESTLSPISSPEVTGILREPLRFPDFKKIFGAKKWGRKNEDKVGLLRGDDEDRL